jgi:hypothetical protein
MSVLTKLAFPLWLSAICAMATVPAHAQFQGAEAQMGQFAPMLEQFAPMIEQMAPWIQKMQNRIGKKRMARLVQMAEPLMSMMPSGDGSPLGVDGLTSLAGDARGRHARRHK